MKKGTPKKQKTKEKKEKEKKKIMLVKQDYLFPMSAIYTKGSC